MKAGDLGALLGTALGFNTDDMSTVRTLGY